MSATADWSIRPATEADWPQIHPFFADIVDDGETYAYAEGLTSDEARQLWLGQHHVVVLEEGGRVLGSATMGPNGAPAAAATSAPGRS